MPNVFARAIACACLAAAIRDFDGTQPVLRQSPPIFAFSMRTTGTPNAAAAAATESPPEPAPITQISGVNVSVSDIIVSRTSGASVFASGTRSGTQRKKARSTRSLRTRLCPWVPDLRAAASPPSARPGHERSEREFVRQIVPLRVHFLDQRELPCAVPAFQHAFACSGLENR